MEAAAKRERDSSPLNIPNSSSGSSAVEFHSGASPSVRTGSWKMLSSQLYEGMSILHPRMDKEPDSGLTVNHCDSQHDKGTYSTYMEKEIFEQPNSTERTLKGRVDFDNYKVVLRGIQPYMDEINRCRRMIMIGAGTSFHIAVATRQLIEELTELPVMVELASDFLDREVPVFRDDVCLFISQSGETAATLEALRYCKGREALVMGITNTVNSTLSKETYCGVHANGGVEIGVASTKSFTSQILTLVMFALMMAEDFMKKQGRIKQIIDGLKLLPDQMRTVLELKDTIKEYGREIHEKKSLLIMGRGYQYATCMEGAFKVKEVAYMHSEGILSGELKHGPLALIDEDMPVVMIISSDCTYDKCMNALQQVTARHGRPIILCTEDHDFSAYASKIIKVPKTVDCLQGCVNIIPLQLLAMYLAQHRGHDVDRPRNLVKAVTDDS